MFANLKMKYRLLLVIFLPTVILLGFDIKIFWDDYSAIQRMHEVRGMAAVTSDTFNLISNLEDELALSNPLKSAKGSDLSRDLADTHQKTNSSLAALNNTLGKTDSTINGRPLNYYYDPVIEKINALHNRQNHTDGINATSKNIAESYGEVITDLIDRVVMIARESEDLNIARNLFAAVTLSQNQQAANTERYLVLQAVLEDKISQGNYNALETAIGEQKAFETNFLMLANDEQDALYNNTVKGQAVSEANHLRHEILNKGIAGKFGVDPKKWWEVKSAYMNLFQDVQKQLLDENMRFSDAYISSKNHELFITIGAIIFTLFLSLVLLVYSLRNLTNKLKEEVDVLAASGSEILNSITEASTGTAETATAVTETTTTVEELKQTAQIAAEKAKNVSDVSEEALQVLKNSEETLNASITGMNNIQEGMGTISESIIKLSEHSQSIGKIIDSVNDLAEQSHLLAVNAAIEAAKAGDQGRGFVIVAQEMRNLAEQSKQATEQVKGILNDIQNSTSAAVMATERGSKAVSLGVTQSAQVSQSIRSLSSGVANVAQAAAQISLSSQQQLVGVGQVTIAMGNIKESSNQHVEQMRQIETGIKSLNGVGEGLNKLVSEYKF